MGASVQPQSDPVASYLAKYGGGGSVTPPPVRAESTSVAHAVDPVTSYLAKYGRRSQGNGDADEIASTPLRWLHKGAETIASGWPGGRGLVGLGTGLADLVSGKGIDASLADANQSIERVQRDVASVPGYVRVPLQMIGGAPLAAAVAPLGVVGGGAAFGAAAGADRPVAGDPLSAQGLRDRALNIGKGAIVGGVAAKGAQLGGELIANIGARTGATDAIAKLVRPVSPNTAAAMGTEGQVNKALGNRQDILDNMGDIGDTGQSAAEQQIAREAATKTQAKVLYDAARNDTQAIDDPELNALLSDPAVQKQYQNVVRIRNAGPNPLPTVAAPEQVPLALQKLGISQERYAELQALGQTRSRIPAISGTDILPEELTGPKAEGVSLPDPQALALLRKELYNVARGYQSSSSGLKQEEALDLLDKVDRITEKLYAASPARQTANQFYAGAKGEEEGFGQGFDAFRNARKLRGNTLTTNSTEAQQLSLDNPRYPSEPASAQQARGEAFRLGVAGAAKQAVLNRPVDRGLQSILDVPELAPTQPAMQTRALMFGNPDDAAPLEQTLARLRGEAASQPSTSGEGRVPTSPTGILRNVLRKAIHAPDLIETPQGQRRLADLLRDPALLQQEITASRQGSAALGSFQQGLASLLAGQVAR